MRQTDFEQNHRGLSIWPPLFLLFTLSILAALFFAGSNKIGHNNKKTSAIAAMSSLVQACEDFNEDQGYLPLHEGMMTDHERLSDNDLMSILVGLESAREANSTGTAYFKFKKAMGTSLKYHGLDRSDLHAKLYGPWKNQSENNRYYRLVMDYDFNEQIQEPHALGGAEISGERVLIYHLGKDGQAGPGMNKDNVYSYK